MGAATIAPVGRNVRPFRTRALNCTSSLCGPSYTSCSPSHERQASAVSAMRRSTSAGAVGSMSVTSGGRPAQREPRAVALGERERGPHGRVLDLHRHSRSDGDLGRSRTCARPPPWAGTAAARARTRAAAQARAASPPRPRLPRPSAAPRAATSFPRSWPRWPSANRHRVRQAHDAGVGREGRLEHQRAGQVAAGARERLGRADRPVTGVGIQDPREQGRAVVVRQAEPVDRPVQVDVRRRVAVGEHAVVGDRAKGGQGDGSCTAVLVVSVALMGL